MFSGILRRTRVRCQSTGLHCTVATNRSGVVGRGGREAESRPGSYEPLVVMTEHRAVSEGVKWVGKASQKRG